MTPDARAALAETLVQALAEEYFDDNILQFSEHYPQNAINTVLRVLADYDVARVLAQEEAQKEVMSLVSDDRWSVSEHSLRATTGVTHPVENTSDLGPALNRSKDVAQEAPPQPPALGELRDALYQTNEELAKLDGELVAMTARADAAEARLRQCEQEREGFLRCVDALTAIDDALGTQDDDDPASSLRAIADLKARAEAAEAAGVTNAAGLETGSRCAVPSADSGT